MNTCLVIKYFCWRRATSADNLPADDPRQDEPAKIDAVRAGHSAKVRCKKGWYWYSGDPTWSFNGGGARQRRSLRRRCRPWRLQTRTNSPFRRFHWPLKYRKNKRCRRALPTVTDLVRPRTLGLPISFHVGCQICCYHDFRPKSCLKTFLSIHRLLTLKTVSTSVTSH